jgi:hypothetical protein
VANAIDIAAVGADGSLLFFYQIDDGKWNPETVLGPATSASSGVTWASIAHVGNSAVIAAVHADGTLSYHWQTIGADPTWNEEWVPAPGTNDHVSEAAITQVGNSSVIAAVTSDGSLNFYWQTIGKGNWNPESVTGPNTANSVAVAQVGNSSVIAAIRPGGDVYFYYQPIGGNGAGKPPWPASNAEKVTGLGKIVSASIAQVGNGAGIAAVGGDGSLSFAWQPIGGSATDWGLMSVAEAGQVVVWQ